MNAARAVCPSCMLRYAGVIDPGCAVCHGLGFVGLGDRTAEERATVVARAVQLYLGWAISAPASDEVRHEQLAGLRVALEETGFLAAVRRGAADRPRPTPDVPAVEQALIARRAIEAARQMGVLDAEIDGCLTPAERRDPGRDVLPFRRRA